MIHEPAVEQQTVEQSPEPAPDLRVERLTPEADGDWDAYVRRAPLGTAFHLTAWKRVVERTFRHRAASLLARRGDRIVGVLPLFHLSSWLFGRSLVSSPYAIRGGILADDAAAAKALLDEARSLGEQLEVDYLELRSEQAVSDELHTKELYVTFRADLSLDEDELLKQMKRKRRQMMNFVAKQGFETRVSGVEDLAEFYHLFCVTMRYHGTPVYPLRFFQEIFRQYEGQVNLFSVRREGRTLFMLLNLMYEDVVLPFYLGSVPTERVRGGEECLYWSVIRWAKEAGYRTFDFGRSKLGTGPYEFKKRWGMAEIPLGYQYHLVRAQEMPNVSPANPRYRLLINAWRRLPLPLTRLIGPRIIRNIP